MIDLDVIETEIDNTIRHYGGVDLMQCSYVKELVARLRQAEKDAARYRWLRDTADVDGADDLMISIIISDEWDSLIDEAMQCK